MLTTTTMKNHQVSALEKPVVSMGDRCVACEPPKHPQNKAAQRPSWSSSPEMNTWSKSTDEEGRTSHGDAREDFMGVMVKGTLKNEHESPWKEEEKKCRECDFRQSLAGANLSMWSAMARSHGVWESRKRVPA